jgi:hypothetical protein
MGNTYTCLIAILSLFLSSKDPIGGGKGYECAGLKSYLFLASLSLSV